MPPQNNYAVMTYTTTNFYQGRGGYFDVHHQFSLYDFFTQAQHVVFQ
jgi:hypothetical protein